MFSPVCAEHSVKSKSISNLNKTYHYPEQIMPYQDLRLISKTQDRICFQLENKWLPSSQII